MLQAENINKQYGERLLLDDASFTITEGERIGLIGLNGTGKSTLLHLLAGLEETDSGNVSTSKDYTLALLSQEPEFDPNDTILEAIYKGNTPLMTSLRTYEFLLQQQQENHSDELQQKLFTIQNELDVLGGWDVMKVAEGMLSKLGIFKLHQKIGELSGGQKKRLALASLLVQKPDLLLLDEPTNHLDVETISWLEEYLKRYTGAVLFVTHDRYFLDRVSTKIFELHNGKIYSYLGNFENYLEQKAIREEEEAASYEKLQNTYRNELAWIRRGAKARSTKQKARIDRFQEIEQQLKREKTEDLNISLEGSRLGKQVFEFDHVFKSFDELQILNDFTHVFQKHDRIGIIGKNGVGKTTFFDLLTGEQEASGGQIKRGSTVKIAYYRQGMEDVPMSMRMIDYIREEAQVVQTTDGKTLSASAMLERFLFPPSKHGNRLELCSGGERKRLYLLRLLMSNPNVLLLDEPTNDLDLSTLNVLEEYLDEFSGAVFTISHDRYFLERTTDKLLAFEGNGIVKEFYGTYEEYMQQKAATTEKKEAVKEKVVEQKDKKKKKLSYHEQREWDEIPDLIESLEQKLVELEEKLAITGSNFEEAARIMEVQKETENELETKMDRWAELAELVESFGE